MLPKTKQTEEFFQAFAKYSGNAKASYVVGAFGDNPDLIAELTALVLSGVKRATASLVRDYSSPDNPLPKVGDFVVCVDGAGNPQCIFRTTEVEIKPLIAVDERFAWDEGEGDRTRTRGWLTIGDTSNDRQRGTASRCTTRLKPFLSGSRLFGHHLFVQHRKCWPRTDARQCSRARRLLRCMSSFLALLGRAWKHG